MWVCVCVYIYKMFNILSLQSKCFVNKEHCIPISVIIIDSFIA